MQLIGDAGCLAAGAAIQAPLNHPLQVPLWIDLATVVVGALAGTSIAVRERLDAVGVLLLAVVMGLGGGIIRDLLLGLRPAAVTSRYYLPTVAAAAVAGYLFTSHVRRFETMSVIIRALSVGLFTVVGVEKALFYGLPYASAIFIGVTTSVSGGLLVDLIAGRPVAVVHRGPWLATAALAGASVYAVTAALSAPTRVSQAAAFIVVVVMRLASLHWGLQNPPPTDLGQKFTPSRRRGSEDPRKTTDDKPAQPPEG